MLSERERMMYDALGKNVKVICKNGRVIEGHCSDFIPAIDNEPEVTEIGILRGTMNLVGITEPEIDKIEYLD